MIDWFIVFFCEGSLESIAPNTEILKSIAGLCIDLALIYLHSKVIYLSNMLVRRICGSW